jgi:hypothetical protein
MAEFVIKERYAEPATGQVSSYFSQLYILVDEDSVQYCILDTEVTRFIVLADYRLDEAPEQPGINYPALEKLISDDELLQKKYPLIIVGIHSPYHTLVPSALYDAGQISSYMDFNYKYPEDCFIVSDRTEEIDSYNISGIPAAFRDFINAQLPGALIVHGFTPFIKASYQHHKDNPSLPHLYLNIRKKEIDFILLEGNKPVISNSFPYLSKEDILYYLLLMASQNGYQQDQFQLIISGLIEEKSDTWQMLEQYLSRISLARSISLFKYSAMLEQAPAHVYQDLYALVLCGL